MLMLVAWWTREHAAPRLEPGFLQRVHSPRRIAAWREAYFYGVLIAAVFIPFDFLYAGHQAGTVAARGALVASLAACWWLLGRPAPLAAGWIVCVGHVGSDDVYGTVDQSIVMDRFRLEVTR